MAEHQKKPGENRPLLVTTPGDHLVVIPATNPRSGWSLFPKKTLIKTRLKLSDLLFAFWTTLTIITIGILTFYVVSSFCKNVKWPLIKHTENLEQRNVNNIVHLQFTIGRGTDVPFSKFTEILAGLTTKFPKLKFEVHFYLSDSVRDFAKFNNGWRMHSVENRILIKAFENQHRNLVVSFKPLSKLVACTPLRYTWEVMSLRYLNFYAGVQEVYYKGGIAMDLEILAKKYNYGKQYDKRIETLLQRYNDGGEVEYNDVYFDDEKKISESELFLFFSDIFEQLMNDTRYMFSMAQFVHPLINTRFERKSAEKITSKPSNDADLTVDAKKHVTENQSMYMDKNTTNTLVAITQNTTEHVMSATSVKPIEVMNSSEYSRFSSPAAVKPINVLFSLLRPGEFLPTTTQNAERVTCNDLYMDSDGSFLETKLKAHPFLIKILLAPSFFGITPNYVIEKLYTEQCGALCNNIHIF